MGRVAQSEWLTTGCTVRDRIPVGARLSALPDRPWAHPVSCKMGTCSFPGVKCGRSVLLTTHPFYCSGQGRVELYLYTSSGPHRACNGKTLHNYKPKLYFITKKLRFKISICPTLYVHNYILKLYQKGSSKSTDFIWSIILKICKFLYIYFEAGGFLETVMFCRIKR